jgi:hypothetical protein
VAEVGEVVADRERGAGHDDAGNFFEEHFAQDGADIDGCGIEYRKTASSLCFGPVNVALQRLAEKGFHGVA